MLHKRSIDGGSRERIKLHFLRKLKISKAGSNKRGLAVSESLKWDIVNEATRDVMSKDRQSGVPRIRARSLFVVGVLNGGSNEFAEVSSPFHFDGPNCSPVQKQNLPRNPPNKCS